MGFQPGNRANPGGRPAIDLDIRLLLQTQKVKIFQSFVKYMGKEIHELEELKKEPTLTGLDRMVVGVMYKAFKGDRHAFQALIEPIIGKATQPVEMAMTKTEVFASLSKDQLIKYGEIALQKLRGETKVDSDNNKNRHQITDGTHD